jgi:hypothetical protein
MNPPIGFVLITHNNPEQILFLCEQLTARFDRPPIVIHHDFHQTPLNTAIFPANVTFVPDWLQTNWGGFAVVDGQLRALRILYKNSNPDWFVVLSGADYPINSSDFILRDLYGHDCDAYLDHRRIQFCRLPIPPGGWGVENFIHPSWVTLAFERYMAIGFGFYKLATRMNWRTKALYLRSDFLIKRLTPFDGSLHCYAGDHWLTGSRSAANALLEDNDINRRLTAHYRKRPNPDEAFHHTVLCNDPSLRVSTDNKRYADWEGCTNHPRTLTESDFPRLLASTDHFARKFAFHPEALLVLNRMIDEKPRAGHCK